MGYWCDGQTKQPERSTSFERRLKAEAEKRKLVLTPERINGVLPTKDLRRSFSTLSAATLSLYNLAVLEKKQNVLEIREKNVLNEELLKHSATLYIGTGLDIEYPLCFGARNIVMIDPIFKDKSVIERLRLKISELTENQFTENDGHFYFKFDFGQGKE